MDINMHASDPKLVPFQSEECALQNPQVSLAKVFEVMTAQRAHLGIRDWGESDGHALLSDDQLKS